VQEKINIKNLWSLVIKYFDENVSCPLWLIVIHFIKVTFLSTHRARDNRRECCETVRRRVRREVMKRWNAAAGFQAPSPQPSD